MLFPYILHTNFLTVKENVTEIMLLLHRTCFCSQGRHPCFTSLYMSILFSIIPAFGSTQPPVGFHTRWSHILFYPWYYIHQRSLARLFLLLASYTHIGPSTCLVKSFFYVNSHEFGVWSRNYSVEEQLRCAHISHVSSNVSGVIDSISDHC